MSKSPLNIYAPAIVGVVAICGTGYILADQFVVDLPAPIRGEVALVSAAQAEEPEADAKNKPTQLAANDTETIAPLSGGFGLGRAATEEEISAWDIDIRPDGQGLPEGEGDVWTGEEIYVENCAMCHGDFGEGAGRWPQLALGMGTLTSDDPVKTVGSYWPYLSTVWDYVHRAMPYGNAQSLSDDEVYAITAYVLYLNELVDDDFVLSSDSFTGVEMPNAGAFYMDDRPETELVRFAGDACMENCKDDVEITARARVVDVTPEGEGETEDPATEPTPTDDMADDTEKAAAKPSEDLDAAGAVTAATEQTDAEDLEVAAADPALIEEGAKVFRKCQACHQVGEGASNRVGPELNGLIGRKVGSVSGFSYSGAFQDAAEEGVVWTEDHLAEFLANPRGVYSGTKMSFAGLQSETEIEAVTAYIEAEGTQ